MENRLDPRSGGVALANKAIRFLQIVVMEKTTVQELDAMYRQVIAFVADEILDRIAKVDDRIRTWMTTQTFKY
ncbi:MAG TPA: hypothetical protein VN426_18305 [Syntrophomonadaceae bacterium]|nr:hypothetical protein [Syntrophomonadaceae bacterium]